MPFGYLFNGKWLDAMECQSCGIIFIHPQPSSEEIRRLYSKEYFEGDFRCGHEGSYFDDATLDHLADESLLDRIKKYKPEGDFLEVGCAGGAFLNAARKAGYNVRGVEFSEDASEFARTKFHLDVVTGDLMDAHFSPQSFDVIFMGDVLEHLPKPGASLGEINRIMKQGGLLVIECPMQTNTLFSRLGFLLYGFARKKAAVHLPPYHLFEYRPASMRNLLLRSGYRTVRSSESIISPSRIALRGSFLENIGKKVLQYPNYVLTHAFGMFGDRIEIFAMKQANLPS